eukprot:4710190-Amphidinium_carterae.1
MRVQYAAWRVLALMAIGGDVHCSSAAVRPQKRWVDSNRPCSNATGLNTTIFGEKTTHKTTGVVTCRPLSFKDANMSKVLLDVNYSGGVVEYNGSHANVSDEVRFEQALIRVANETCNAVWSMMTTPPTHLEWAQAHATCLFDSALHPCAPVKACDPLSLLGVPSSV